MVHDHRNQNILTMARTRSTVIAMMEQQNSRSNSLAHSSDDFTRHRRRKQNKYYCIRPYRIWFLFVALFLIWASDLTKEVSTMNFTAERREELFLQSVVRKTITDLPSHPHAGARFPNGTIGLVIDPSTYKFFNNHRSMSQRAKGCQVDSAIDTVAFEVFQRIRSGAIKAKATIEKENNQHDIINQQQQHRVIPSKEIKSSVPRILCMVYTHSNEHARIKAIVNTWGKDCDGFFAASNVTDLNMNTINLTHKGPESYSNMWQKIRSMWAYAHDHFLEEYDYFHISGDDSYVVVDNMKAYLQGGQVTSLLDGHMDNISKVFYKKTKRWENLEKGQQRPLLLGVPQVKGRKEIFPVGGPGYTLNREALRLIGAKGGAIDTLLVDNVDSREDVFIANLLLSVGVVISDTRDETGAFRYIKYQPKHVKKTTYPKVFNIPLRRGMSQFSNETVALHLKEMDIGDIEMDEVIYRTHDIIGGGCDEKLFISKK